MNYLEIRIILGITDSDCIILHTHCMTAFHIVITVNHTLTTVSRTIFFCSLNTSRHSPINFEMNSEPNSILFILKNKDKMLNYNPIYPFRQNFF